MPHALIKCTHAKMFVNQLNLVLFKLIMAQLKVKFALVCYCLKIKLNSLLRAIRALSLRKPDRDLPSGERLRGETSVQDTVHK